VAQVIQVERQHRRGNSSRAAISPTGRAVRPQPHQIAEDIQDFTDFLR